MFQRGVVAVMMYRASSLRALAIVQMVVGDIMLVLGVSNIFAINDWSSDVAFGVWIGVWVGVTGILGYNGAKNDSVPRTCLIGCFMGFSITSCVMAGVMIISESIALSIFADSFGCRYSDDPYEDDCYYGYTSENARRGIGFSSALLVCGVVEFCVGLASSILCCGAVCCNLEDPVSLQTQRQPYQLVGLSGNQMNQGGLPSVVVMQPSGQVTTLPAAAVPSQQTMFVPQQPTQQMQPAYWTQLPVSTAGDEAAPIREHSQQAYQNQGSAPPNYARAAAVNQVPETESGSTNAWEPEANEGSLLLA